MVTPGYPLLCFSSSPSTSSLPLYQFLMVDAWIQEAEKKCSSSVSGRSIKDVAVDPIMTTPSESPARWPSEFERRRLEIIELWHLCNISIVRRTFFFLLCLCDPGDSIYLELELRRLRFIKRALAGGNGTKISPSSKYFSL